MAEKTTKSQAEKAVAAKKQTKSSAGKSSGGQKAAAKTNEQANVPVVSTQLRIKSPMTS